MTDNNLSAEEIIVTVADPCRDATASWVMSTPPFSTPTFTTNLSGVLHIDHTYLSQELKSAATRNYTINYGAHHSDFLN